MERDLFFFLGGGGAAWAGSELEVTNTCWGWGIRYCFDFWVTLFMRGVISGPWPSSNGEAVFLLLMDCFMVLGWWMVKVSCRAWQGFSFAHFKWWSKILFLCFGVSSSATEKILRFFFFITLCAHRIDSFPHLPPLTSKGHCHENTPTFMFSCSSLHAIWDGW